VISGKHQKVKLNFNPPKPQGGAQRASNPARGTTLMPLIYPPIFWFQEQKRGLASWRGNWLGYVEAGQT